MQFAGSNILSIIWHPRYNLFILHASSSSCVYKQIIPMTSTLLICKMKLVLIQKGLLIHKFQIFYCNSSHHQLNIPQQHPHSDLRFNFTKSSHATAVLIIVRVYSNFSSSSNHLQRHPTCELNLYSYWMIRPKRRFAAKIFKWESEWHQGHIREISQRFSQHPTAYLLNF